MNRAAILAVGARLRAIAVLLWHWILVPVNRWPELAAAAILVLLVMVLGLARARADVIVSVDVQAPSPPATDCGGAALNLDAVQTLPPCVVFTSTKGGQIRVQWRPAAQVAGASSGTRVVYAKTAGGKLGAKLGTLSVGTTAKPLGYFCDPTDVVKSGTTVYARITDPAVGGIFAGGYTTGCSA